MKMCRRGLIGLACLVLIGVCFWQARQLRQNRLQLAAVKAALEQERHARAEQDTASQYLERREREWKEKAMQLSALVGTLRPAQAGQTSNVARLTHTSDLTPSSAVAPGQTNEAAGMFGKGMGAMISKMMKDPNMKEMMRAQQKMAVKMMYGPLIADLNLPPEQQQKLNDLLLDQQMQTLERSHDMFKEEGADLSKIAEKSKDVAKESDAAMRELLGQEKFEEFQESKKTMTERMQLSQFKDQLQGTDHPLRDEQSRQILVVIKEERERYPPVFDANAAGQRNLTSMFEGGAMERQMEWQEQVNQRVKERLAPVLSPEQLKEYAAMQEQQLTMQKFGMKMAREMFGKGGVAPAGPGASPTVVPAVQK